MIESCAGKEDAYDDQQSNSRFEAARQQILAALPADAPTLDKEDALSEFYRHWVLQEGERLEGQEEQE